MNEEIKVDRRRNYFIVLDTETCNTLVEEDGQLNMSYTLIYDIGWAVTDKHGNIFLTRSFIIKEIWEDVTLMTSAYYARKIPQYLIDIQSGYRQVVSWYEAITCLKADMELFGTSTVFAHNAGFDYNAMNVTQRYLTKSKYRYALPYGTIICDSLKMASDTIGQMPSYRQFCEGNGYMTKHKTPRPKLTAEVLYRFISKDYSFVESHTALEDVLIEKDIVAKCYKVQYYKTSKKPMRTRLWEN